MDGLGIFGTLILKGPLFEGLGQFFLDEFQLLPRIGARNWGDATTVPVLSEKEMKRAARHKLEKVDGVLWTAASVRGLVLVKFGAREVEGARKWLGSMVKEEHSIQTKFGEGALP
ncbi:MAG: urease accessory [Lasallia pustulata]|uniref:Urease accessory n=1 Tax=Lasallia pustulata TaxID=136370 RepID=A0A5M8PGP9_9LECA|nr:MAG: urease accessory [Lasallia pustulata]